MNMKTCNILKKTYLKYVLLSKEIEIIYFKILKS